VEIVRILLFFLMVGVVSKIIDSIVNFNNLFLLIANLLFFFVLYRNKLQFSGWYQGTTTKPLSKRWTLILASVASACYFVMIILKFV
ncbi:MAG: hypothetical protein ACRC5C_00475, partial [Bacilli bacterium]